MIIGIDPGVQGCITYNDEEGNLLFKFLDTFKVGKVWSVKDMNDFFSSFSTENIHIALEDVGPDPIWTAKTNWELSRCKALLEGVITAHKIPLTLVKPKAWQKEMFEGVPEMRKPSKTNIKGVLVKGRLETKLMSVIATQRLLPSLDVRKSTRAKNAHDGKTDSILIREYILRKIKA